MALSAWPIFSKFGLLLQHTCTLSYSNVINNPVDDLHSPNLTVCQCFYIIRRTLLLINTILFFVLRSIIDLKDVSFGIKSSLHDLSE